MGAPPLRSRATWAIPVALYLVAAIVYVLLGTLHEIPLVFPDELRYGHMARSIAAGDGIGWGAAGQSSWTALYIYLLVPSWLLSGGESAYDLAKATSAIAVCTVVFPVWLLARELLPPARAAIPAVLVLAGTWMTVSAGMLTENLAFPLATAALVSAVLALRAWPSRWRYGALVFAALATVSRPQMGLLFVILLAALALDAALSADWRGRLEQRRVELAVLGAIVLAGVVLFFSGSTSALGIYAEVKDLAPGVGDVPAALGKQWISLAVMSGVLPLAAVLALASRRAAWADRDLGPLLCVTLPAIALLLLETAYFNAGFPGLDWGIERYVVYAMPLMLVAMIAALDRALLPWRIFGLVSAIVALSLLAAPDVRQAVEQRAWHATSQLVSGLIGATGGAALAIAGVLVAALATLVVARSTPARAPLLVGGVLLIAYLVQAQWFWRFQIDFTKQIRAQYPPSLSWVDDHASGPVTRLYLFQNSFLYQRAELFNERVEQSLVPAQRGPELPPLGPRCEWTAGTNGDVQVVPGCGDVRSAVWNDDPYVRMSFHGGRVLARDDALGQLIAVPERPRLRSVIRMPCQRVVLSLGRDNTPIGIPSDAPCPPTMSVAIFTDRRGTLELTFQGGAVPHEVSLEERRWTIPARDQLTIRLPVTPTTGELTFATGFDRRTGPDLVDATLVAGGDREPLL